MKLFKRVMCTICIMLWLICLCRCADKEVGTRSCVAEYALGTLCYAGFCMIANDKIC